MITFVPLLAILTLANCSTSPPSWIKNPFFSSGQANVLSGNLTETNTSSSISTQYDFTFNSSMENVPKVAYGIKEFRSDSSSESTEFYTRIDSVHEYGFTLYVQIDGQSSTMVILDIAYLIIDRQFPDSINVFDCVAVSLYDTDSWMMTNQGYNSTKYINQINYTRQATGKPFNIFSSAPNKNKIVLFLTVLHLEGNQSKPVDFTIQTQIKNQTFYSIQVTLSNFGTIFELSFSQIVFDSQEIQSTNQFAIITGKLNFGNDSSSIEVNQIFFDGAIVGLLDFSTGNSVNIDFNWEFGNSKINIQQSFSLQRQGISFFYLKTWSCPTQYYYQQNTQLCYLCSISNCSSCLNNETCISCDIGSYLNEDICQSCQIGCINCLSLELCLQCDEQSGFQLQNDRCKGICGDGIISYGQQCDDGNTISIDGCSSTCLREEVYICLNQQTANATEQCLYKLNYSVTLFSVERSGCNSLILKLEVDPKVNSAFKKEILNFFQFQHQNISKIKKEYGSVVEAEIQYKGDITNKKIKISQPFVDNFNVTYDPVVPAVRYSSQVCSDADYIENVLSTVLIVSYICILATIVFNCKIIGLEYFNLLQLTYFCLANQEYLNIYLAPFANTHFNGYNMKIYDQTSELPEIFQAMNIHSLFLNNFNIMYLIIILVFFIGLILLLIGVIADFPNNKKIGKHIIKEYTFFFIYFNSSNIFFSASTHWNYATQKDEAFAISSVGLYLFLVVAFIALVCFEYCDIEGYGELKNRFKESKLCRAYLTLSFIIKIFLAAYIPFQTQFQQLLMLIVIIFLLYIFSTLPFNSVFRNIRACFMNAMLFLVLVLNSFYISNQSFTVATDYTTAITLLISLLVALGILFLSLLYEGYYFAKELFQGGNDNRVSPVRHETTEQNFEIDGMEEGGKKGQGEKSGKNLKTGLTLIHFDTEET